MDRRAPLAIIGGGITTFFVVAVAAIELLDVGFSAIIGLPLGAVAGIGWALVVWASYDELPVTRRRLATAYGAVGTTLLLLLAARYVNLGRDVLTVEAMVGTAVLVGIATYLELRLFRPEAR